MRAKEESCEYPPQRGAGNVCLLWDAGIKNGEVGKAADSLSDPRDRGKEKLSKSAGKIFQNTVQSGERGEEPET